MRRTVLFALMAFPFVILGLLFFIPRPGRRPEAPEPERPEPAAVTEEKAAPREPRAACELAIGGLVLDADLRPVPAAQVRCGSETAAAGEDGKFRFPAAARPGRRPVAILGKDGTEMVRWEAVLTGDLFADPDHPEEGEVIPERIRWTVTLGRPPADGKGPAKGSIQATGVLVEEWGPTGEALIAGRTDLPDGAHLDSTLLFDGERVLASMERAEARSGAFLSRIRFPDDYRIHPATYDLDILFAVALEDPADVERWAAGQPDGDWTDSRETVAKLKIYAGDRDEELVEDRKIEGYFGESLDAMERLRKILMARVQRAKDLSRRWDPEVVRAAVEVEKGSFGALLDPSGRLDVAAWRRFLDEGWRPEVVRLIERHAGRKSEPYPKYRSGESLLEAVLNRLILVSKIESGLVYRAWGVEPDRADFYLDEDEGDEVVALQVLRKDLAVLNARFRNLTGDEKAPAGAKKEAADPAPKAAQPAEAKGR